MMKNLNEQFNIDFKNGTWSLSTSDDNSDGGSDSTKTKVDSKKTKVDSTNPNSADYYSDYQTDETESETVKRANNNNSGDYSDYSDAEEDDATIKSNDYSDYSDAEENDGATPTNQDPKLQGANLNTTKKLTNLTKIELDIMQKYQPLVYKTAFDKLGAVEQKIVTDKLAGK